MIHVDLREDPMQDTITAWLNAASRARKLDANQTVERLRDLKTAATETERVAILNEVCQSNLLLVASTVKKYVAKRVKTYWNDEKTLDLLQQGYFGLRRAAEKFDADRNIKFSTYAVVWIRQSIGRYSDSKDNAIYIPEDMVRAVIYEKTHGKPLEGRRITKDRRFILAAANAMSQLSLDVPASDDGTPLHEFVPARVTTSEASSNWASNMLNSALERAGIDEKAAELIRAYASNGVLQVAATKVRVPAKEARGIVNDAIEKMRQLA